MYVNGFGAAATPSCGYFQTLQSDGTCANMTPQQIALQVAETPAWALQKVGVPSTYTSGTMALVVSAAAWIALYLLWKRSR